MTPERIATLRRVLDQRQPDLVVITDCVHKPRNTSAIARNCDAVGVMTIHTVARSDSYRPFRGTAAGSQRWVDIVSHANLEAALGTVAGQGLQIVAAHLDDSACDFREVDYTRPTALLLGAEKAGVSAAGIARADYCVTIPMVGMVRSYNVAVAAGIILTEAQRQRQRAGMYRRPRIDEATYRRLFFEWGHPAVTRFCQERLLDYPALDEEGEIFQAAAW
jgi:tRNA (guanosine-2'-O-)-methyltransferase